MFWAISVRAVWTPLGSAAYAARKAVRSKLIVPSRATETPYMAGVLDEVPTTASATSWVSDRLSESPSSGPAVFVVES